MRNELVLRSRSGENQRSAAHVDGSDQDAETPLPADERVGLSVVLKNPVIQPGYRRTD